MDPLGSFEADQVYGQSWQTVDNIGMEPVYYNAAERGEIRGFKNIEKSHINQLLTPNRNTVLHIYLTSLLIKRFKINRICHWNSYKVSTTAMAS